jgi:hypothetical protein
MTITGPWHLLISKDHFDSTALQPQPVTPLDEGQIEVRLTQFALTANNVTYCLLGRSFGVAGETAGYWSFFPSGEEGQGLLPVWGFATISASRHPDLPVGDTLYGYFPFASHAVFLPERVTEQTFVDGTAHRRDLPPVYNQYTRLAAVPAESPAHRELWPVFRPLLTTGFLIADQIADNGDYGAERIIIASASSKTAMMTAHSFRLRQDCPTLIGLTSAGNADFVRSTGLFDSVVTYDALTSLNPEIATAYIDMAGDGATIRAIHDHLGSAMKFSLLVGKSHWQADLRPGALAKLGMAPFFAPAQMKKRSRDWGPDGLRERLDAVWSSFAARAEGLTTPVLHHGPDAGQALFQEAVAGRIKAQQADIVVLD